MAPVRIQPIEAVAPFDPCDGSVEFKFVPRKDGASTFAILGSDAICLYCEI
jgi:hypothetical protein